MDRLWTIYHEHMIDIIEKLAHTSSMQRLKNVGMNCGVEYTKVNIFSMRYPYSRYDHSVGVALIIYHFTKDIKQAIAGLFHDLSTPCFAHVIDFLNNDHDVQESYEYLIKDMIVNDVEIMNILNSLDIKIEEIADYHQYPIADNNTPRLSADRLEYTLGNMYNYGFVSYEDIKMIYDDLYVKNDEIVFKDQNIAKLFCENMLKCSKIYICNEDRFCMQFLADIIKVAINDDIIKKDDLYLDEKALINKLNAHKKTAKLFNNYCNIKKVYKCTNNEKYCIKVSAKIRYIDPIINDERYSRLDENFNDEIIQLLSTDFDFCLTSVEENMIS